MRPVTGKTEYRKAIVLVAVLWTTILLSLIVSIVAQTSMIDTRISNVAADRVRCKWACRAGLEMAVAVLNDDELELGSDSLYDMWYEGVYDFNSVPLDMCNYSISIVDESSRLNLNTVTKEQLLYLPDMTEEVADSIIDWRDSDDNLSQSGAESGYYLNLPFGYSARNADFKTVRELLLVKGVTPGLFYGDASLDANVSQYNRGWVNYFTCYSYDINGKDAEGNDRVNVNSAGQNDLAEQLGISTSMAMWIVQNRNFNTVADLLTDNALSEPQRSSNSNQAQPLDVQTFCQIVDKVTVSGGQSSPGRVNINTASKDVLTALFEGRDEIAYDIIAYRQSMGTGMTTIGELGNIKSITVDILKKVIGSVTTRSSVYTVYSTAVADATRINRKIQAVVDRDKSPAEILYFHDGAIR